MNQVEVCFSPLLFEEFAKPNSIVVVVDVFRATSAIVTALHYGAKSFIPVSTIEEARELGKQGFLAGGARNGEVVEGFEFGNSPFSYMNDRIKGREIAMTTTNGTRAINIAAKSADTVLIGSFLNYKHWLITFRSKERMWSFSVLVGRIVSTWKTACLQERSPICYSLAVSSNLIATALTLAV